MMAFSFFGKKVIQGLTLLVLGLTYGSISSGCEPGTIQVNTQSPEYSMTGKSCELSFDCDSGELCLQGRCALPRDCQSNAECNSQLCLQCTCGNFCVPEGTDQTFCTRQCCR